MSKVAGDNKETDRPIDPDIDKTINEIESLFEDFGDIVKKKFRLKRKGGERYIYITYIDGLADNEMVERTITHPLLYEWREVEGDTCPSCDSWKKDGKTDAGDIEKKDGGAACAVGKRERDTATCATDKRNGKTAAGADEKKSDSITAHEKADGIDKGEMSPKKDWDFSRIFYDEAEAVDMTEAVSVREAVDGIVNGDTAVFIDGQDKAIILSTKNYPVRSLGSPEKESGLKGPRDAFNENLRTNTALLRRRIKDTGMKLEQDVIGVRSKTTYGLMYMEELCEPELLIKIREKLDSFKIDGIFDSSMLVHLLEDKWYSPFPQVQTTERPDKAASAILEGRVVMVVDNSSEVIIFPATFNTFFQAADDYYNRFAVATFARFIRYVAAYMAVLLPGLYVAVTCFYPQVLPTDFLLAIVAARNDVTFPVVVEVLLMEFLFELLREAGIRLPGQLGNTMGVVGGLIVGQAAVDASLVSTIVVIVVALTALCSFAIPNEEFASTFRLLKFVMIIMGAVLGLYGIMLAILVIQIHLASLESFGIPYMMPLVSGSVDDGVEYQDFLLRKPVFSMRQRPVYTRYGRRRRFLRRR